MDMYFVKHYDMQEDPCESGGVSPSILNLRPTRYGEYPNKSLVKIHYKIHYTILSKYLGV
jgi:hypothetical protein